MDQPRHSAFTTPSPDNSVAVAMTTSPRPPQVALQANRRQRSGHSGSARMACCSPSGSMAIGPPAISIPARVVAWTPGGRPRLRPNRSAWHQSHRAPPSHRPARKSASSLDRASAGCSIIASTRAVNPVSSGDGPRTSRPSWTQLRARSASKESQAWTTLSRFGRVGWSWKIASNRACQVGRAPIWASASAARCRTSAGREASRA